MPVNDPVPLPILPVSLGQTDYVIQGTAFTLDPVRGESSVMTAEGTEGNCLAVARQMRALGLRATVTPIVGTPQCRLQVYYPDLNDDAAEVPTVRWSIKTEIEDVDIFTLPDAADEMSFFNPRSAYRKFLVDAAKNGDPYPIEVDSLLFPFATQLYNWLCEGVKAYPQRRTTLYRTRSMSWDFATPAVIDEFPFVYTTRGLIRQYGIPAYIQRKLPLGNSVLTPPGRRWAWLELNSDVDSQEGATFKQDEQLSWVFAPWETSLYNFVD
jgi:hypothetical protein